jgi:hypothetical protein
MANNDEVQGILDDLEFTTTSEMKLEPEYDCTMFGIHTMTSDNPWADNLVAPMQSLSS